MVNYKTFEICHWRIFKDNGHENRIDVQVRVNPFDTQTFLGREVPSEMEVRTLDSESGWCRYPSAVYFTDYNGKQIRKLIVHGFTDEGELKIYNVQGADRKSISKLEGLGVYIQEVREHSSDSHLEHSKQSSLAAAG